MEKHQGNALLKSEIPFVALVFREIGQTNLCVKERLKAVLHAVIFYR